MPLPRNRQLNALVGGVLLVIVVSVFVALGGELLDSPVLAGQVALLGAAGLCDIVAGTDSILTHQFAWYRWSGLGNIFLGSSLPLGGLGFDAGLLLPGALALGGLSLILMGVDMLIFHGRYVRSEPFDTDTT